MLYKTILLKEMKEGTRGKICECKSGELKALGICKGADILVIRKRKHGGIFIIGGKRFALSASFFEALKIEAEEFK